MDYVELCGVYEELEKTSKRLEKTKLLAGFLKGVGVKDLERVLLLLQGIVYPVWDSRKLGFSSNYIIKAVSRAAGVSSDNVKDVWRETGDLGESARVLLGKRKQVTLVSSRLTVEKVFSNVRKLADQAGSGSVDAKVKLIAELLADSSATEAKFIVRTVLDELRIGLGEGTLRDSLVWAYLPGVVGISAEKSDRAVMISSLDELKKKKNYDFVESDDKVAREVYKWFVESVRKALDVCNDFGQVAVALKEEGLGGLNDITLAPGAPLKVMLALKEDEIEGAFKRVGKPAAIEYKLDGFRVQVHVDGKKIQLFTRRLEDVTLQFPDIVGGVQASISGKKVILDCEAVGVDLKGTFLPFQSISQRIKRKYDIDSMAKKFPVELHVFDVLYHEKSMLNVDFIERRTVLEKIVSAGKVVKLIEQIQTDDSEKAEKFYDESLKKGNEGVMFKTLDAPYKPGARVGYLVKMKPVMETLDLVVVGAEWGEGKRGNWLSSYVVACRSGGDLLVVGRVSTGLKEKPEEGLSFEEVTSLLKPLVVATHGKEVNVKPKVVLEVKFEEIQASSKYTSGFALRFPRVVRLREDRDASSCSEISDVKRLFQAQ
jgi:DNA ligase 1